MSISGSDLESAAFASPQALHSLLSSTPTAFSKAHSLGPAMILDANRNDVAKAPPPPLEEPPAYSNVDYTQTPGPSNAQNIGLHTLVVKRPGPGVVQLPQMPPTTVYHYVHPVTQEHITSLLPPDHPEMICLQEGGHVAETRFGLLGILAAIFWFPLGIGLCILDRRTQCSRCGLMIDNGLCA